MDGYTGPIYDTESWHRALADLVLCGASSRLPPKYLEEELTNAAEATQLLEDTFPDTPVSRT